jgi:sugar/nucleoside kinase (ribokinase family)
VIVVVGSPAAQRRGGVVVPAGRSGSIAIAAAEVGHPVQLVGRVGDDDLGDALILALARAGIGHAAVLRDAAHATPAVEPDGWGDEDEVDAPNPVAPPASGLDAADIALGLRYLTDFSVLVIADRLDPAARRAAVEAGRFAGARVIAIVDPDEAWSEPVDDVFEAPTGDGAAFAGVIGRYAAALHGGTAASEALDEAARAGGWTVPAEG